MRRNRGSCCARFACMWLLAGCGRIAFEDHAPGGGDAGCAVACPMGTACVAGACEVCDQHTRCGATCKDCTASGLACDVAAGQCAIATDCSSAPDFTACNIDTTAVDGADRSYDICMGGTCISPGCSTNLCNVSGPSFQLPDTGQITCYDMTAQITCPGVPGDASCATTPFCGQDAQYGADTMVQGVRWNRTEPVANEPIVEDAVTGLLWQGCLYGRSGSDCSLGATTLVQSFDTLLYCDQLTWAGSSDWRMPDNFELFSLMHLGPMPSDRLDRTAFPNLDSDVWAGDVSATMNVYAFTASFALGVLLPAFGNQRAKLCVQTSTITAPRPLPSVRFTRDVATEPVVTDAVTGLRWQGCVSGLSGEACEDGAATTGTWSDALGYCESLTWNGRDDWRLPSSFELHTIADVRKNAPPIDAVAFPGTPALQLWTSTTDGTSPGNAYYGTSNNGGITVTAKTTTYGVRCVAN